MSRAEVSSSKGSSRLAATPAVDGDLAFLRRFAGPLVLLARAMLVSIFLMDGWHQVTHYGEVGDYMSQNGVAQILTHLCGGILVLIGVKARWAAIALMGFCLLAALFFHMGADQANDFGKNSPSPAGSSRSRPSVPAPGRSMPGAGAPVRWKQEAMTAKRMSAALLFAAAAAIVAAAALAAGLVADASAETSDIAPMAAPCRIDDAPSAGKGAFAFVENFVWRAFVSLNWPSLLDATDNRLDPPNVSCPFTPPSTTHSTSSATSHPVARSASSEKKLSGRGELLPQPES
jgi:putative oxidoreductase